MSNEALLLVVGGDRLAERVCGELLATAGHRVRVVWPLDAKRLAAFRELGASVAPLELDSDDALVAAGVMEAASLLALSDDDGLNLSIALRARSLNADLRIVVRQFNVELGVKSNRRYRIAPRSRSRPIRPQPSRPPRSTTAASSRCVFRKTTDRSSRFLHTVRMCSASRG